jgi:hypothetical protein
MSNPAIPETTRRKPGRPPLAVETEQVSVRIPSGVLARVDDWRRVQGDLPSRPEGIRRLMELGLSAHAEPRFGNIDA